jgi:hypothetical protein
MEAAAKGPGLPRRLLRALASVKLALVLLAYLAATGILASLIPQGREAAAYAASYPPLLALLIIKTGFWDFYSSALFFIPAFAFFANLCACSARRFLREIRKEGPRRHGPDILHLGLILLVLGAVLGQAAKASHPDWQGFARLSKGEAVQLPDGKLLTLMSLASQRYPDGRPKDWISSVRVSKGGTLVVPSYDIRVNHPLRLGPLSIFQVSFGSERVLELVGPSGETRSLAAGESIETKDGRLMLMAVDLDSGVATASQDGPSGSKTISLKTGSKAGAFVVAGAKELALSGLQAAYDPAYPIILAAFAIIAIGAFLTFAKRIGELKP